MMAYEEYDDSLLGFALEIATDAHDGQRRWGKSKEPYISHPIRVAEAVKGTQSKVVALLHDVLEDSEWSAKDLERKGIPYNIVYSVKVLTRHSEWSYLEYIKDVMSTVIAREVKIADLKDNLRDLKKGSLRDKYELALYLLTRG